MTTSSVPESYSTTSSDTITISNLDSIDLSSITTINYTGYSGFSSYTHSNGSMGSISISGSGYNTISPLTTGQLNAINAGTGLNGTNYSTFTLNLPEDWVNQFPDWSRVQAMCKEYPGLEIAFEKFKTTYKLVKDHYDTPPDQRPRP
jgi:hypothetical protein